MASRALVVVGTLVAVTSFARLRPKGDHESASRTRVGRALVCPYCRDRVGWSEGVACARSEFAALYHRGCWSECAGHYGGCAIYGCGSLKAREFSVLGHALFVLKLILAALFLPPSIARRVSEVGAESLPGAAVRAFKACRKALPDRYTMGLAVFILAILQGALPGLVRADGGLTVIDRMRRGPRGK